MLTDPQVWLAFADADGARDRPRHRQHHFHFDPGRPAAEGSSSTRGRTIGLALAMLTRILLLLSITWVMGLSARAVHGRRPRHFGARPDPDRRRPVPAREEHAGDSQQPRRRGAAARGAAARATFLSVITQIAIIDIVFSLDSVITAVGMADHVEVMIAAVVVAVLVMMFLAGPIGDFVDRHPTIKMLALSFLILIGMALVGRGPRLPHPEGLHLLRDGVLGRGRDAQHPRAQARAGAGQAAQEARGRVRRVRLQPDRSRACVLDVQIQVVQRDEQREQVRHDADRVVLAEDEVASSSTLPSALMYQNRRGITTCRGLRRRQLHEPAAGEQEHAGVADELPGVTVTPNITSNTLFMPSSGC